MFIIVLHLKQYELLIKQFIYVFIYRLFVTTKYFHLKLCTENNTHTNIKYTYS